MTKISVLLSQKSIKKLVTIKVIDNKKARIHNTKINIEISPSFMTNLRLKR